MIRGERLTSFHMPPLICYSNPRVEGQALGDVDKHGCLGQVGMCVCARITVLSKLRGLEGARPAWHCCTNGTTPLSHLIWADPRSNQGLPAPRRTGPRKREYWCNRFDWTEQTMCSVQIPVARAWSERSTIDHHCTFLLNWGPPDFFIVLIINLLEKDMQPFMNCE